MISILQSIILKNNELRSIEASKDGIRKEYHFSPYEGWIEITKEEFDSAVILTVKELLGVTMTLDE